MPSVLVEVDSAKKAITNKEVLILYNQSVAICLWQCKKGTHITGAEVSEQNVLDSTLRRNETDEQLIKKPIEMAHYQVTYMDNG